MQLSETMKDVLKQLCMFEKQLAKHIKKGLGIFLYNKNLLVLFTIQFQGLNGNLLKSELQIVKF